MSGTGGFRYIGLISLLVVAFVQVGAGHAQQSPATPRPSQTDRLLLTRLYAGSDLDRYLEQLREEFAQLDADSDGKLTERDSALHTLMEAPQVRVGALNMVMRYDLDADGVVSEDEIRRTVRYEQRGLIALAARGRSPVGRTEEEIERMVQRTMALDADKDGKVTFQEAVKFGQNAPRQSNNGFQSRVRDALTLDAASSGELSLANYQAAGEIFFRAVDADSDGKISQQELNDFRRRPATLEAEEARRKRLREQTEIAQKRQEAIDVDQAKCAMPAVSTNAKIVLLGAYETEALSNVTIGTQDVAVDAGRIVIEPGSEPLYVLVATSRPVIWQFSGAVERVERVVLTSATTGPNGGDAKRQPLVGATGISQERVSFFAQSDCMRYFSETPSSESFQATTTVRKALGRSPDVVVSKRSAFGYAIPSGKIESFTKEGRQPLIIQKSEGKLNIIGDASNVIIQTKPSRVQDEMKRFHPGGVVEIDARLVVASAVPSPYDVLPDQAGLVQLVAAGKLAENREGEFVVRDKIRFPAGLHGAHSVTFLVPKGIPYPDGDPGHSCVISEETGANKSAACPTR
jgi:Ca2+-binding EF-hand superfamily protein